MLRWLLRQRVDAYERSWGYDMDYVRDMLAASPAALIKYALLEGFATHRDGVPADAWFAAKLGGTLSEDCGHCTQLIVEMAFRSGVHPALVRDVVQGNTSALNEDAALGLRFAQATFDRSAELDQLRRTVLRRWGPRGLVSLAFATASARIFPALRYALGHGQSCHQLRVHGQILSSHVKPAAEIGRQKKP